MKIPYGVADLYRIRTRDQLYVDCTDRIAMVLRFTPNGEITRFAP